MDQRVRCSIFRLRTCFSICAFKITLIQNYLVVDDVTQLHLPWFTLRDHEEYVCQSLTVGHAALVHVVRSVRKFTSGNVSILYDWSA